MTCNQIAMLSALFVIAQSSYGYEVPEEFKDFYSYKKKTVEIKSVDGVKNDLEVSANYDSIKIVSQSSRNELLKFLNKLNVEDVLKDKIIQDFTSKAIKTTDKCKGAIDSCVVIPDTYAIAFDYEHNIIYFFISPKYLKKERTTYKYISNVDTNSALINSSDIYVGYNDSSLLFTLNDRTILGLKYGYLQSDFSYQESKGSSEPFDLRKLAYILDYESYLFQIGSFDGNKELNSTAFLSTFSDNTKNISFNISSSENLLAKDREYYNAISFYAPSSGYLTVKKDDVIVYQMNINAGQGRIPYSLLPAGVYNVEVVIRSNGSDVFKQNFYVYNVKGGRLAKGASDFFVTGGIYTDDVFDSDSNSDDFEHLEDYKYSGFLKGAFSYGIDESAMVGAEIEVSQYSDYKGKVGLSYIFKNGSILDLILGRYKEGSNTKSVNFTSPWFGIYYDELTLEDDDFYAMYNENGYSRKSISINKNFTISPTFNGNLSYNYNKFGFRNGSNRNSTLSVDLDYRLPYDSVLSTQFMYEKNEFEYTSEDEYSVDISLSIPFGDDSIYTAYISGNEREFNEFRNEISKEVISDNKYADASLSVGYSIFGPSDNDRSNSYMNLSGNYDNDNIRSSLYTYIDTTGERNINIGLSNTQVLSNDSIDFTSNSSKSYLRIDVESDDERLSNLGLLSVDRNSRKERSEFINKTNSLIPLNEYKHYHSSLDSESVSLENRGQKEVSGFSYPGSVYTLSPKISKIVSFITAFDDVFEQSVNKVSCKGDGCVSVENIDENIFNVKVRAGSQFMLYSDDLVCLTPGVKNIKTLNLGVNHCVPNIDTNDDGMLLTGPDGLKRKIYFLGIFKKHEREKYLARLTDFDVIEKDFNSDENLVYVSFEDGYLMSMNERSKIDKAMLTAENSNNIKPFVLELDKSWLGAE